jgi:hypothetical protein
VQRCEDPEAPWVGQEPLWIVAPHMPAALADRYSPVTLAPGCHLAGPAAFPFLWIAANELPLEDELVPFLIARSGRPLEDFLRWVKTRRPLAWLFRVLTYLPMSTSAYQDLEGFLLPATDDPDVVARIQKLARSLLDRAPDVREELIEKGIEQGRLKEDRDGLRRVLALRKLALSPEQDARIDACADLETLRRWHDQAVFAASTADALR